MNAELVSLVIPGRNCALTIRPCLAAVTPLLQQEDSRLAEIIFVDDRSTDETVQMVSEFPVRCLPGTGGGASTARNIGWRAARHPFIWFMDSDCVAEPDALTRLLPHLADPKVGGVGGSYGIMNPESLLSSVIHEEIVERHRGMTQGVNFLATFNVIYRRAVLESMGGFNERYRNAEDAELAFRVIEAGHELRFEQNSRVKHFHPARWGGYLKKQFEHGYERVWLHLTHSGHAAGDSYSGLIDHLQPPTAMLTLASAPLLFFSYLRWIPIVLLLLLLAGQVPMTFRLLRRLGQGRHLCFVVVGFLRAYWRGVGMTKGVLGYLLAGPQGGPRSGPRPDA